MVASHLNWQIILLLKHPLTHYWTSLRCKPDMKIQCIMAIFFLLIFLEIFDKPYKLHVTCLSFPRYAFTKWKQHTEAEREEHTRQKLAVSHWQTKLMGKVCIGQWRIRNLKTNICDEWVCGEETSGTTLIPIPIPIHSFPECGSRGRVQQASAQFENLNRRYGPQS